MSLKLYKSSSWWYGDFLVNGQRKTVNLHVRVAGDRPPTLRKRGSDAFEVSRIKAQAALDSLRASFVEERGRVRLIEQLRVSGGGLSLEVERLPEYAAGVLVKMGRSEKYVKEVKSVVKDFVDALPEGGRVDQVSRLVVKRWVDRLEGSARTQNKKRKMIQWLFGQLVADGYVDVSPADRLRPVPGDSERREALSDEEVASIKAAAGDFLPVVICGLTTGLRLMDCVRLKYEQIDFAEGWVSVKTAKRGGLAEIPLHDDLRAVLDVTRRKGFCFPEYAEMHVTSPTHIYRRIREAAKVDKDFHCLRVTFITRSIAAGVPVDVLRKVTAHQTVDVVLQHYFRPDREAIRQAYGLGRLNESRQALIALIDVLEEDQISSVHAFVSELLAGPESSKADPDLG